MTQRSDPARGAVAVSTSNTVDLPGGECRALYIGVTGDVKILTPGATAGVVFKAVAVGILPVQAVRVYTTGTTATDIVALY